MDETNPLIESSPMQTAQNIPGVELLAIIGSGGMSQVYKARHLIMDEIVAVKIISASALGESGTQRFMREAKRTAALVHPAIVQVKSAGMANDGNPYIVMEYIEGQALSSFIESGYRFSSDELLAISKDVMSALSCAHQQGIIHRDIKPGNIMVSGSPHSRSAKLVDFGIARSITDDGIQKLTKSGFLLGTPAYMSPEQCSDKDLDLRSDLYSFACVLFECIVGRKLFVGDNSLDVMYQHLNSAPQLQDLKQIAGIKVSSLLDRALSKDRAKRPTSADEFATQLEPALKEMPLQKLGSNLASSENLSQSWPSAKLRHLVVSLLPMLIGVLAGASIMFFQQDKVINPVPPRLASKHENEFKDADEQLAPQLLSEMVLAEQDLKKAERLKDVDLDRSFNLYNSSISNCQSAFEKFWIINFTIYDTQARAAVGLADSSSRRKTKLQIAIDDALKRRDRDRVDSLQKKMKLENNAEQQELRRAREAVKQSVAAAFKISPNCDSVRLLQEIKFASWVFLRTNEVDTAVVYLNAQIAAVEKSNKRSSILPGLYKVLSDVKAYHKTSNS